MRFRPNYLSALLVAAALGAGCDVHVGDNGVSLDVSSGKATEEWSRSYTVNHGGTLEIVNSNGPIVVEAGTGAQVEVKATKQVRARSDEEAQAVLKNLEITEEVTPGRVSLQTTTNPVTNFGRRSATVEYRVRVPAGLQVSVKTDNGGIGLHDVDGTLAATTTNGGIRGTNISGAVTAHIVNGGIVLDMARVSGALMLDSINGSIRLDVPANLNADVDAHAVNGGVVTEAGLTIVTSERSRTRVAGKMNRGGVPVSVSTVNGGVRIGVRDGSATSQAEKEGFDEAGPILVERKR
jgi:DUF4097 and DUF4098 domain-containing protein YvlB